MIMNINTFIQQRIKLEYIKDDHRETKKNNVINSQLLISHAYNMRHNNLVYPLYFGNI